MGKREELTDEQWAVLEPLIPKVNEHWFITMEQARRIIEAWRIEYNTERPHSSLGNLTPEEFAKCKGSALLTADSNAQRD